MTLTPGSIVTDERGTSYRVVRELGAGGQGVVFEVTEVKSGKPFIAKLYHREFATKDAKVRLDALVRLNLPAKSPILCGPIVRLDQSHGVGAIQPKVEGQSLEEIFQTSPLGLLDALGVGTAICRALGAAAALGIGHGDIAASNLILRNNRRFFEATLIDFDNAALPGAPAPTFRGQDFYAAPELLAEKAVASVESDRFALAVLLYELLLLRHPFSAAFKANIPFPTFVRELQQARWMEDPADGRADVAGTLGGLPVGALPRDIQGLFRAALQPVPATRPPAEVWAKMLEGAMGQVFRCDACSGLFVNEATRYACPYLACRANAPTLALEIGGKVIPFPGMTTTVGRDDLGGDPTVSRAHAVFQRRGFAIVVHALSGNGLAVKQEGGWVELPKGGEVVAAAGDRVRFAVGVEGVLAEAR